MNIYVFASNNLTNIWAGIDASTWAVSRTDNARAFKARKTRATQMPIGSFGLLYCNATHALTTPFIVCPAPDGTREVVDVWPETWVLPFRIHALGNPTRQLRKAEAKKILPSLSRGIPFHKLFHVQGLTAFAPSPTEDDDWAALVERLAT